MAVILFAIIVILGELALGDRIDLSDNNVRQQYVGQLKLKSQIRKAAAVEFAKRNNMPMRWVSKDGSVAEIMGFEDGGLTVYQTNNSDVAISIGVDKVRQSNPFNVSGNGVLVGLWDEGNVLATHQEFGGRVVNKESSSTSSHSTHVCGTIAAAGVDARAKGMAPEALVDSYNWNGDTDEMASRAMSTAGEAGTIPLSNHSYAIIAGWYNDGSKLYWYGAFGDGESYYFGQYNSDAHDWDDVCYKAPYYLPFKAAGNDRNDAKPADGAIFYYLGQSTPTTYNGSTPYADGYDNGGFDTIATCGVAKNIVTVGAVNDAVTSGLRDLNKATMAAFSCWGPADDGRIKPDLVTNGTTVYSSISASNTSYSSSYSGTSMASPSACGAAAILIDYYGRCFPGQYMRASTIKGLMIHTADDLGNPGPDYKFGWGLLNAEAAANVIKDQNDYFPDKQMIFADTIVRNESGKIYTFVWNGTGAIKATLCWTDPPGIARTGLDNTAKALVNDLDLRIIDSNGTMYYPFVLNPTTPNVTATTGDNVRDNVEQVYIAMPQTEGTYRAEVSYETKWYSVPQTYSLILTGQNLVPDAPNNVRVSTADVCGQVILSWSDANYAEGYNVYYQENVAGPDYQPSVNGVPLSGADVGDVNFVVIDSLTPGTDYHFAVVAYNTKGYSGYSADVNVVVCNQCPASLSGYVRTISENGIEGVLVAGSAGSDLTDANGFYEIVVPYQWSGAVIASKLMWNFTPVEIVFSEPLTSDANNINFIGTRTPDLAIDGVINFGDFAIFGSHWLDSDCKAQGWCDDADLDLSGTVDFIDLQLLTERWLDSI